MKPGRILGFLLAFAALPALAQTHLEPEALVRKITSEVLETVRSDKDLAAGDREKALALAEQKVLPHIDFREAARLAVGRSWNSATPQQQDRLVTEFRAMLVRIYSNAIDTYRGQTLRVLPVKMAPTDTDVTVRNQYLSPGKPPVGVEYAMRKTPEGWKIYDIVVENVSLVLTYRSEFDQVMRQSGVEGLIRRMNEKNHPAVRRG
jgi:phospholipid transport system substrate-binding protein